MLDVGHVSPRRCGGFFGGATALASVYVRRVPIPPVVPRGDRLERAMMLGSLMQELCESRNVDGSHPGPGAAP